MASPHTAGMLAYLLSLYPHKTFDPFTGEMLPEMLQEQRPFLGSFQSTYELAYSYMPSMVSRFLPPPVLVRAVSEVSDAKTLTPKQLKAALIALSSKDMLKDIPSDTVNLLIFNNYTTSH
jgi:cerevisin